ncbi:hypothetical protein EDC04DRAFT_2663859 [Pisolithus marmoratus]|nr:hypothetical protein EDC04DRAFT_2663859 [Pisolithus marmoratus]
MAPAAVMLLFFASLWKCQIHLSTNSMIRNGFLLVPRGRVQSLVPLLCVVRISKMMVCFAFHRGRGPWEMLCYYRNYGIWPLPL